MPAQPLESQGLSRRYRRRGPWALRDISLSIPEGSITALVGPNGAGKSTLIRACLGFEPPDAGRVLIFGVDPAKDAARAVNLIGYIPQSSSLYRGLTIGDHFVMARVARDAFDLKHASARTGAAGLTEDRTIGELSGGEQAQVALALAIGTRAPLLLLDEPLASLDPLARREFLSALLVDVRHRGATAVLSSHIVADVEQICDRLVVLAGGTVVLNMTIEDAMNKFRTVAAVEQKGTAIIGAFAAPDGEPLALTDVPTVGRPASLEEIVLAHLASVRTVQAER
jgi:ABC-2 type transport system ATP-binding protein